MWMLVLLVALGAVLPLATSLVAGSLEIPRNDDWSYRRIAAALAATGRLEMDGAAETMLLGQVVLTQPILSLLDGDPLAFSVAGFLFAVAAVSGAYLMARQILPPARSSVVALSLGLFPGYLAYATSYMNDVPALGAQLLAIALGAVALSRRPTRFGWLVAAALVGCLAFSMRHFALAAPAAVIVAAICAEPKRIRIWGLVLVATAACVGLQLFRSSLPGQLGEVDKSLLHAIRLPAAAITVSFVLLPAAILGAANSARSMKARDVAMGAILGGALATVAVALWLTFGDFPDTLLRNLVTRWGVPDQAYLTGGRPVLFPDPVWAAVNLLALVAVVIVPAVMAGVAGVQLRGRNLSLMGLARSAGSPIGVVALFAVAAAGGLAIFGSVWIVFDRYLWPIVPPLAVLLMIDPPEGETRRLPVIPARIASAGAAVTCVVLAAFALPLMANSHAFDAARWRAGDRLLAAGIRADTIDAGYEWVGYYATVQPDPARPVRARIWYLGWWPSFRTCGLVSSTDVPPQDGTLIATDTYPLYLVAGPSVNVFAYRVDDPDCPPAGRP